MPYGRRRYGRIDKSVPLLPPSAIPTFICPHCGKVKSIAAPYIEVTALDKNKLFLYSKVCGDCAKLLQDWMSK